jgi:hypothetical protein
MPMLSKQMAPGTGMQMLQQEALGTQGMISLRMCFSAKLKMQQPFVVIQAVLLLSQLEIWY